MAEAKQPPYSTIPAYSPELNPDEILNQDVESNAVGRRRAHNQKELMANVRGYLIRRILREAANAGRPLFKDTFMRSMYDMLQCKLFYAPRNDCCF